MNIIAQEAKKRQAVVKLANRKGKSYASRKYGVSLSSVKRWCKRYDGTWQSLAEKSHRPHSHPKRHTASEEQLILKCFQEKFLRYGWDGVYDEAIKKGYTRSFSGMVYAAKRMGLGGRATDKKPPRKHDRRYPELLVPGEKVQIKNGRIYVNGKKTKAFSNQKILSAGLAADEITLKSKQYFVVGDNYNNSEDSRSASVGNIKRTNIIGKVGIKYWPW